MSQHKSSFDASAGKGDLTTKTYVKFLFLGVVDIEPEVHEVKSRDLERIEVPTRAFGVEFFDRTETKTGGETVLGKPRNFSGRTYFGGEIVTLEEAKADYGESAPLVTNMEGNGWSEAVKTRLGNFQPLEKGDSVLDGSGNQIWPKPDAPAARKGGSPKPPGPR